MFVVRPVSVLLPVVLGIISVFESQTTVGGEAEAVHEVTLELLQVNVLLPVPVMTLVELADKLELGTEGSGVGVGVGTVAPPHEPV